MSQLKNDFVWVLLRARVSSAITNVDSSQVRPASLDKRAVGWTEEWGNTVNGGDTGAHMKKNTGDDDWARECNGLYPDSIHMHEHASDDASTEFLERFGDAGHMDLPPLRHEVNVPPPLPH